MVECQQDAFSDYPVPAALDEVGLSVYLRESDVALENSWGAYVDGEMAAFCLGAVRGSQGSIRGEGTAVAYRRRGIGSQVLQHTLESLHDAGAVTVGLEVLDRNLPAIALYERHEFRRRRKLVGWSLRRQLLRGADHAVAIAPAEAVRRLRAWGWSEAPWQLQIETLKQLPAYALGDDTVAVAKLRGRKMWLYALAVDPANRRQGRASALIRSLPATRISIPALMPEEWEAGTALLRSLGSRLDPLAQWEMALDMSQFSATTPP